MLGDGNQVTLIVETLLHVLTFCTEEDDLVVFSKVWRRLWAKTFDRSKADRDVKFVLSCAE